jgi:glyoxylate/hydroxypyruvate reductase
LKKEKFIVAFLIIMPTLKIVTWEKRIRASEPGIDLRVWPEVGTPEEVGFILSWRHPHGEFLRFPNLKCIASMGAGVDNILSDPDLPSGVPITRIVDGSMAQSMSEYVVMSVLNYCRNTRFFMNRETEAKWQPSLPRLAEKETVGILGLGQLGLDAARKLMALGFKVAGWRRSDYPVKGILTYCGPDQFNAFLAQSRILVNLLPQTSATENILNRDTFAQLPRGAYLINVARGRHLVEEDLLEAIESGQLSGACLDVFRTEPLPAKHSFWKHPAIAVTPHIASLTNPDAVIPQIMENYRRILSGQEALNQVDRRRGY